MTITEILKAKGVSDDVIKGVLEDMKVNKIFTASEENLDIRYGKLKTEHETVVKERDEGKSLIAELQKTNKGNEELQSKVADYESRLQQLQAQLAQTQIDADAQAQLLAAGVKAEDLDYVMFKLKAKGDLELGEDGKVKGMEDKIAALKTQLPGNFTSESKKNILEYKLPTGDPEPKTMTKEDFNKLGYNGRVQLKQENPELYNQMMKG